MAADGNYIPANVSGDSWVEIEVEAERSMQSYLCGIGYLMETTVDCKHGILTGVDVYPASEKGSLLVLRHLEQQIKIGVPMERLALDRGYGERPSEQQKGLPKNAVSTFLGNLLQFIFWEKHRGSGKKNYCEGWRENTKQGARFMGPLFRWRSVHRLSIGCPSRRRRVETNGICNLPLRRRLLSQLL